MILQLLNQYVYKLEYIILGTIKDTPIKISIDDTFYDIRQKINNPDLVKIHKEDLKKYDFDMKYGRNNVLKDIIHSMYKNSYNCDIFLGIGGNDKKAHKYRTNNNRQVIVVDKVIALRFGQRDEKQFRSASQLDIVEIVINTEHLEELGDTYRIKFIDSDEKSLYDFALEIGLLITEQSDASLLDGALVSKEANYINMNIIHGDIAYNLDDSEFETGRVYQESLREISKGCIEHTNKASYFLSEATLIINDTPINISAEEGWIIDIDIHIHIHESKSNNTSKIPRELLKEIDRIQSLSEFKQPITLINNSLSIIHDNSIAFIGYKNNNNTSMRIQWIQIPLLSKDDSPSTAKLVINNEQYTPSEIIELLEPVLKAGNPIIGDNIIIKRLKNSIVITVQMK